MPETMFSHRDAQPHTDYHVWLHTGLCTFYPATIPLQQHVSTTHVSLPKCRPIPRPPRPLNISCPSPRKEQWPRSLLSKSTVSKVCLSVRDRLLVRNLPSRREGHVHSSIASDHIVPKHVGAIHAEHNLWPLGRIRLACGENMDGVQ